MLRQNGPMTQQPFSRPGAVDLSALKRPTGAGRPAAAGGAQSLGTGLVLRWTAAEVEEMIGAESKALATD